jgi:dTMP kinase
VGQVIGPALARGAVVLSDRYADSTIAYQGYGRRLDLAVLREITEFATGGLTPDMTIYLDITVDEGLNRKRKALALHSGEWNRLDQEDVGFHRRVRQGYLELAAAEPDRWLIVDASRSVEEIQREIQEAVKRIWD